MPHKHTRRTGDRSDKDYDLPPSRRAAPLPTRPNSKAFADKQQRLKDKATKARAANGGSGSSAQNGNRSDNNKPNKKRKREDGIVGNSKKSKSLSDDTPAEFRRLMLKSAHLSTKNRKVPATIKDDPDGPPTSSSTPRAAPSKADPAPTTAKISGNTDPSHSTRSATQLNAGKGIPVLQNRASRLQRKIEKKVATWHAEEARLREREAAARFSRAEEHEERVTALLEKSGVKVRDVWDDDAMIKLLGLGGAEEDKSARAKEDGADAGKLGSKEMKVQEGGQGKRRKKSKAKGTEDDWAVLKERREKPRGLHDVVQAPPELRKVKALLGKKATGAGEDAEGLKHKADLSEARMEVIQRYRAMMGKGGASGGL